MKRRSKRTCVKYVRWFGDLEKVSATGAQKCVGELANTVFYGKASFEKRNSYTS